MAQARHVLNFYNVIMVFLIFIQEFKVTKAQDPSFIQTTASPCPSGWIKRPGSENCYFWDDNNLQNFYSAKIECNLKNADLLVINDQDEQKWVNTISANTKKHPTDGWYVGLQKTNNKWSWIRGTGVQQPNWNHQPDNNGRNQRCISINQYGRSWDDTCDLKYAYICQYTASSGTKCPIDSGKVKHHYSLGNTCYYVSDPLDFHDHSTWSDAAAKCKRLNPTGTLLTLKSLYDFAFIHTILPSNSPNIRVRWWMGLTQKAETNTYVWQDQTAVNMTFIVWDKAPGTDPSTMQNCAIMYSGGSLADAKCSRRAFYVCEKSSDKEFINLGCGPWMRGGDKCYLFSDGRAYNRSTARSKCLSAGGDLLKVDNENENYWINNMQLGPYGYWTGLTDAAHEGTWLWADGSVADIKNYVYLIEIDAVLSENIKYKVIADTLSHTPEFNIQDVITYKETRRSQFYVQRWNREPNNFASNEDCGMIYRDGVYNDNKCSAEEGYICEYHKRAVMDTCVPGFIGYGGSCYYISDGNSTDYLRWMDIPSKCNDMVQDYGLTSTYIAIDSQDEKSWLENQLSNQMKASRGWWTGLNDRKREGLWMFASENSVANQSLIPWNSEPNNAGGNENCAVMYEGGRCNDLPCSAKALFICEKPLGYGYGTTDVSKGNHITTRNDLVILTLLVIQQSL